MSNQANLLATNSVFSGARDSFLAALSPAEQSQFRTCANVTELLDSIRNFAHFSKSQRRLAPCLEKIKSFGETLSPFFKIIEIVCAARPEWANIALGALLLVLQVRVSHPQPQHYSEC